MVTAFSPQYNTEGASPGVAAETPRCSASSAADSEEDNPMSEKPYIVSHGSETEMLEHSAPPPLEKAEYPDWSSSDGFPVTYIASRMSAEADKEPMAVDHNSSCIVNEDAVKLLEAKVEVDFSRLLARFEESDDCNDHERDAAYRVILRILANVVTKPFEARYRTLRANNKRLCEALTRKQLGPELLQCAGFLLNEDQSLWLYINFGGHYVAPPVTHDIVVDGTQLVSERSLKSEAQKTSTPPSQQADSRSDLFSDEDGDAYSSASTAQDVVSQGSESLCGPSEGNKRRYSGQRRSMNSSHSVPPTDQKAPGVKHVAGEMRTAGETRPSGPAAAALRALHQHLQIREEELFRRDRDKRIQQEKEKMQAGPDWFRRSTKRKGELDRERQRVLKLLEQDQKEREAEARHSVPPSLHSASSRTVSPIQRTMLAGDNDSSDSDYETRLFIRAPAVRLQDVNSVRPQVIRLPKNRKKRGSRNTIATLNGPLDFDRSQVSKSSPKESSREVISLPPRSIITTTTRISTGALPGPTSKITLTGSASPRVWPVTPTNMYPSTFIRSSSVSGFPGAPSPRTFTTQHHGHLGHRFANMEVTHVNPHMLPLSKRVHPPAEIASTLPSIRRLSRTQTTIPSATSFTRSATPLIRPNVTMDMSISEDPSLRTYRPGMPPESFMENRNNDLQPLHRSVVTRMSLNGNSAVPRYISSPRTPPATKKYPGLVSADTSALAAHFRVYRHAAPVYNSVGPGTQEKTDYKHLKSLPSSLQQHDYISPSLRARTPSLRTTPSPLSRHPEVISSSPTAPQSNFPGGGTTVHYVRRSPGTATLNSTTKVVSPAFPTPAHTQISGVGRSNVGPAKTASPFVANAIFQSSPLNHTCIIKFGSSHSNACYIICRMGPQCGSDEQTILPDVYYIGKEISFCACLLNHIICSKDTAAFLLFDFGNRQNIMRVACDTGACAVTGACEMGDDFGDLVLILGDFCVPQKRTSVCPEFRELLNTDRIKHTICTGNVEGALDFFKESNRERTTIVRGDLDIDPPNSNFPETATCEIRGVRFGVIHGHQTDDLVAWQRKLDCDILVHGNAPCSAERLQDGLRICPGSATGAFFSETLRTGEVAPSSFMLLSLDDAGSVLYVYTLEEGNSQIQVTKSDLGVLHRDHD